MSLPTLSQLCRALPSDLVPFRPLPAERVEVTAVHVSELLDPTPFLTGGELLLTAGLTLPGRKPALRAYINRLRKVPIAGIGLGLGPHLDEIPAPLHGICAELDVPLLVVPPDSAFLTVSKEYWATRARTSHRKLADTLTAHNQLVSAMLNPEPVGAILRTLSAAVGAWTALIDDSGNAMYVYPAGRVHDVIDLAAQILEQDMHPRSVVTLPLHDESVLVLPVAHAEHVTGYLAVGSSTPLTNQGHRLTSMTASLLSLETVNRHRAHAAEHARRESVAALLDMGLTEPASRLAARASIHIPLETVTTCVIQSARPNAVADAVLRWCPMALLGPFGPHDHIQWFICTAPAPPTDHLLTLLQRADPQAKAALSPPTPATSIHQTRIGLAARLATLEPGDTELTPHGSPLPEHWAPGLQAVQSYTRADLTTALIAYLRQRGHWDAAARELGIHRNTLRHRINKATQLLNADLDDPDIASQIWLQLRRAGRA